MNILRFHVDKCGGIHIYQYRGIKKVQCIQGQTISEISEEISMIFQSKQKIDGIYIFRGPGRYSKIRSIWAFALGLSMDTIPVEGYSRWKDDMKLRMPQKKRQDVIYQQL